MNTAAKESNCQSFSPEVGSPDARHESTSAEKTANSLSKSRRKHNKTSSKPQYSQKQRFFNSFRSRNSGGVSESPPSDSVGFFFGSTPPESHR